MLRKWLISIEVAFRAFAPVAVVVTNTKLSHTRSVLQMPPPQLSHARAKNLLWRSTPMHIIAIKSLVDCDVMVDQVMHPPVVVVRCHG